MFCHHLKAYHGHLIFRMIYLRFPWLSMFKIWRNRINKISLLKHNKTKKNKKNKTKKQLTEYLRLTCTTIYYLPRCYFHDKTHQYRRCRWKKRKNVHVNNKGRYHVNNPQIYNLRTLPSQSVSGRGQDLISKWV